MTHDTWSGPSPDMPTVYLHEIVDTIPGQEERYMTSVLANSERARWLGPMPPAIGDRTPIQVGLFRTTEVSGTWPRVVNLWGENDWGRMVDAFEIQFARDNTELEDWWQRNLTLRRRGYDRVLLPTSFSPSFTALRAEEMKGRVFLHLIEYVRLGEMENYVDRMGEQLVPAAARHGTPLIGAYRVGLRPRQVLTVWAMDTWSTFSNVVGSEDPELASWNAYRAEVVDRVEELVLLPGRINPLYLRAE